MQAHTVEPLKEALPIKGNRIKYLSTMDETNPQILSPLSILCDWNLLKRTSSIQGAGPIVSVAQRFHYTSTTDAHYPAR